MFGKKKATQETTPEAAEAAEAAAVAKAEEKEAKHRKRLLYMAAGKVGIRVQGGTHFVAFGQDKVPVEGAMVTIDKGETAKRLTATRLALAGPLALAMKKDASKLYLTVEGTDGSAMIHEISAGKHVEAQRFATMVNSRGGYI